MTHAKTLVALTLTTLTLVAPIGRTATGALYERCDEQVAITTVPAALLAEQLPDGFSLETIDGEHVAVVAAVGYRCEQKGAPIHELIRVVAVTPPEELAIDGSHFLLLGGVTSSEVALATYESWCFDGLMTQGNVTVETTEGPAARIGRATADAVPLVSSTVVSTQDAAEIEPGLLRAFAVKDRAVVGLLDIAFAGAMQAGTGAAVVAHAGLPAGPGLAAHVYPGEGELSNTWIMTGEGFCEA